VRNPRSFTEQFLPTFHCPTDTSMMSNVFVADPFFQGCTEGNILAFWAISWDTPHLLLRIMELAGRIDSERNQISDPIILYQSLSYPRTSGRSKFRPSARGAVVSAASLATKAEINAGKT